MYRYSDCSICYDKRLTFVEPCWYFHLPVEYKVNLADPSGYS